MNNPAPSKEFKRCGGIGRRRRGDGMSGSTVDGVSSLHVGAYGAKAKPSCQTKQNHCHAGQ
jgi:hypothetical protein